METITTGITGLDEMIYSGIPDGLIISVIGPAGSGKTIMSLQFLYANLLQGKKCLYISVAHTLEEFVTNSLKFGWDLSPYIENQTLIVKTFELTSMMYSGSGISPTSKYLDELPGFIYSQTADGSKNSTIKPLMSIVNLQSRLLADIQHLLGKMYTEHSIELHYLNLNLEIMNKNLSVINDSILNMGKSVHGDGEIEDMHF